MLSICVPLDTDPNLEVPTGEGLPLAIIILIVIFVFVAKSEGEWAIGMGIIAVSVVALFMYLTWAELADYPAEYKNGSCPEKTIDPGTWSMTWDIPPGKRIDTSLLVKGAPDAETLAGRLHLYSACEHPVVDWNIYADGTPLTHREAPLVADPDEDRDLTRFPLPPARGPVTLRLVARSVRSTCSKSTQLVWENPGLEGPGNGKFRFSFPNLPDPNGPV